MLETLLNTRSGLLSTNDFRQYRSYGSRKVAKLRKKHGLTVRPTKTQSLAPKKPSAPDQWEIELWQAERAWAAGSQLKSASDSVYNQGHRPDTSKFAKAFKHATRARELAASTESLSDLETLELLTYEALMQGEWATQKRDWPGLIDAYCQARVGLVALVKGTSNQVLNDALVSTVDPSLRVALAKVPQERTADVARVAKRRVAESKSTLATWAVKVDPKALSSDSAEPIAQLGPIQWRNHTATVSDADVAQAILTARATDDDLTKSSRSSSDYDKVLLAWQVAADMVHELISQESEELKQNQGQNQDIYIVSTYLNYQILCRRIERDNLLADSLKPADSNEGRVGILKDQVRLYENILQSCDQLSELQGVFNDDELVASIEGMSAYFAAKRSLALAWCYRFFDDFVSALALNQSALTKIQKSKPIAVPLPVAQKDSEELKTVLENELKRGHALVVIFERQAAKARATDDTVAGNLNRYPSGTPSEVLSKLASLKPTIQPVPVKPVLYDIAFNHIVYPDEEQDVPEAVSSPSKPVKKGLFW